MDVDKAKTVDFHLFLQLFLSQCLAEEEEIAFEDLQKRIEDLQRSRFDQPNLRRSSSQKLAKHEPTGPEPDDEEKNLVKKRDDLLKGILEKTLKKVVNIANDNDIHAKLKAL